MQVHSNTIFTEHWPMLENSNIQLRYVGEEIIYVVDYILNSGDSLVNGGNQLRIGTIKLSSSDEMNVLTHKSIAALLSRREIIISCDLLMGLLRMKWY